MEAVTLKFQENVLKKIDETIFEHNFNSRTEFIREAIREKIRKLEEKEIIEDKDMLNQIIESERNIKKRKEKELRY